MGLIIDSSEYDSEHVIEELEEFGEKLYGELGRIRQLLDRTPFHIQASAEKWLDKIESALGKKVEFTTDERLINTLYLLRNHPDVHPRDER